MKLVEKCIDCPSCENREFCQLMKPLFEQVGCTVPRDWNSKQEMNVKILLKKLSGKLEEILKSKPVRKLSKLGVKKRLEVLGEEIAEGQRVLAEKIKAEKYNKKMATRKAMTCSAKVVHPASKCFLQANKRYPVIARDDNTVIIKAKYNIVERLDSLDWAESWKFTGTKAIKLLKTQGLDSLMSFCSKESIDLTEELKRQGFISKDYY